MKDAIRQEVGKRIGQARALVGIYNEGRIGLLGLVLANDNHRVKDYARQTQKYLEGERGSQRVIVQGHKARGSDRKLVPADIIRDDNDLIGQLAALNTTLDSYRGGVQRYNQKAIDYALQRWEEEMQYRPRKGLNYE